MAFIPDDAEDRFNELSPSAERFYIYLCKTRNHKMRVSFGKIDACAQKYEWKRATKFAVVKELTNKGWIKSDGYAWHLLVGDFSPVDKSKNLDSHVLESKNLDSQSKKLDSKSENLDYQSKKSDDKSKNLDSHIRNIPALPETIPATKPEEIHLSETSSDAPVSVVSFSVKTSAKEIFEFWQRTLNHPTSKLTSERERAIVARLREDYTVEQLKTAIQGCRASPYHQGQNDTGTIYDDLTLICRNGSKVEQFIGFTKNGANNGSTQNNKFNANRNGATDSAAEQHQNGAASSSDEVRRRLRARRPTHV